MKPDGSSGPRRLHPPSVRLCRHATSPLARLRVGVLRGGEIPPHSSARSALEASAGWIKVPRAGPSIEQTELSTVGTHRIGPHRADAAALRAYRVTGPPCERSLGDDRHRVISVAKGCVNPSVTCTRLGRIHLGPLRHCRSRGTSKRRWSTTRKRAQRYQSGFPSLGATFTSRR
jgi:hypothetical protein